MGLDMFLHKINKKCSNELELLELNNKLKNEELLEGPTTEEINKYNLLKEGKVMEACQDIPLSGFRYCEDDEKIKYRWYYTDDENVKQYQWGVSLDSYIERIQKDAARMHKFLIPKVDAFMKDKDKDKYVINDYLFVWRKHPDLHGWMNRLYLSRYTVEEMIEIHGNSQFNCVDVILHKEDVEQLISDLEKQLNNEEVFDKVEGFFFGNTTTEFFQLDLKTFKSVLEETDWDNETVYYTSWW